MIQNAQRRGILVALTAIVSAAIVLTVGVTPASANTISGFRTCTSQIRVTSTTVAGSGAFAVTHRVTGFNYYTTFYTPGTRSTVHGTYSGTWSASTTGTSGTVTSASSSCSGIA